MGSETEYAVSGRNGESPLSPGVVYALLSDALQQARATLPDVIGCCGMYLENGARFYQDSGNHPEYATPECTTPAEVACHDKAGERLLELAWTHVLEKRPSHELTIVKNNLSTVDPDGTTWGTHESYTCWAPLEKAAPLLLAHLASRIIYAGAGCLSAHAGASGFELSQRARHLVKVIGGGTTSDRALFCNRIRKVSDYARAAGWTRVHLIGKDSQRAPFGIYLTFGVTGLLFVLLNAGRKVGKGLLLKDPLAALRTISCDPWLRAQVPLEDGRQLTALDIQEAYLADCEREVPRTDCPAWADDVLHHWRETLADLRRDPLRVASKLDPYCKLLMVDHELRRNHIDWEELRQALQDLAAVRRGCPPAVIRAILGEDPNTLSAQELTVYQAAMADPRLTAPGALDRLRLAVRLQVFDIHYHELGGLYDQLAAAGRMQNVVVSPGDIDAATHTPPPGGRAALRSECIRTHRQEGWLCEWRYLYHADTDQLVEFCDPFGNQSQTGSLAGLSAAHQHDPDFVEIRGQVSRHW
jgi:hypothetical protein